MGSADLRICGSAAYVGHRGVVLILLDRGADPDKQEDIQGHTPIDVAFSEGHMDVVKLLKSETLKRITK